MNKRTATAYVISLVMILSFSACGSRSNITPSTTNSTPTVTSKANSITTAPSTNDATTATTAPPSSDAIKATIAPTSAANSVGVTDVETCMTDKCHNVFFGTISTKEICMDFYQNGNEITAFYVFKNDENEYKLTGKIDGFKLLLRGDDQNTLTGTVTSSDEIGRFQGSLTQSNGTKLPVVLDMQYASGERLDNNYEEVGSNNQEVGTFVSELKNNVIATNKQAIATLIHYPIKVKIASKSTTLKSPQEFIDNYDKVMNQDFVNAISNAYTKYLFHNYQGVMFGSNQYNIWIQKTGEKFEIIGINN